MILRNPTHGSGWMFQARPTKEAWTSLSIPPTAVGGSFKHSLPERPRSALKSHPGSRGSSKHSRPVASEHSPPTLCDAPQAQRFVLAPFNKQDLNDPPTAVGGIRSNPFAFVVGWA